MCRSTADLAEVPSSADAEVASLTDLAGDVIVSVSSLADLAGGVTVGVAPSAFAGDITVCVSSPTDLAGGVTIGVAPSADLAGVASPAELAEVASLSDLAGNVAVSVTSLADPVSVVPPVWLSGRSVWTVLWSRVARFVIMMTIMTIDRTILTMILTDFDEPVDYELYHGLHGPDDCKIYCVSRGDVGHDDNISEVVPSTDLAGNVTVGGTSLADPVIVVTAGVAFREECGERDVVPSD